MTTKAPSNPYLTKPCIARSCSPQIDMLNRRFAGHIRTTTAGDAANEKK